MHGSLEGRPIQSIERQPTITGVQGRGGRSTLSAPKRLSQLPPLAGRETGRSQAAALSVRLPQRWRPHLGRNDSGPDLKERRTAGMTQRNIDLFNETKVISKMN